MTQIIAYYYRLITIVILFNKLRSMSTYCVEICLNKLDNVLYWYTIRMAISVCPNHHVKQANTTWLLMLMWKANCAIIVVNLTNQHDRILKSQVKYQNKSNVKCMLERTQLGSNYLGSRYIYIHIMFKPIRL